MFMRFLQAATHERLRSLGIAPVRQGEKRAGRPADGADFERTIGLMSKSGALSSAKCQFSNRAGGMCRKLNGCIPIFRASFGRLLAALRDSWPKTGRVGSRAPFKQRNGPFGGGRFDIRTLSLSPDFFTF